MQEEAIEAFPYTFMVVKIWPVKDARKITFQKGGTEA